MHPATRRRRHLTLDEYFDVELGSEARHEYLDGEVLAMAGGSVRHNRIAANVLGALRHALRGGPCFPLGSDQRLATPDGLYTYPDVAVFCGEVVLVPHRPDTATNPVVLVEVLSDSTRDYDLGDKLDRYRAIPSLRDVLLIEQDRREVVHHVRDAGSWRLAVATGATFALLGCPASLSLDDVYDGVG